MIVKLRITSFKTGILSLILVINIFFAQQVNGSLREEVTVETDVGSIRGLRATDGDYSMFLGIPYAKVDEANPFGPSMPYPKFDSIYEAFDDSAICPQRPPMSNTGVGTLDCLRVNVYVPNSASPENRLPVLIWIHGGAFTTGSSVKSSFGPKYLVRHDVILVTLNYRLGPYGFMCLDIPEVPGNEGLRDQLKALRWVRDHIAAFGGDINKITLFGESAGGMSTDLHLHSSKEKLYNNVIMQSGTSLHPGVLRDSNPSVPLILSEHFGVTSSNLLEALAFLSTIDPRLVVEAATVFDFRPCVEKNFHNVENFFTDYAINKKIPKANGIPILTGYNDDEYLYRYFNTVLDVAESENEISDRINLDFNFETDKIIEIENIVRRFYIGDRRISEENKFDIVDFASDFSFNHPAERSVSKYIENGADKVYFYVFSYVGERNAMRRRMNINVGGATHTDELGYLFDMTLMPEDPSPADQRIIDQMTTMWTNFAKYSDPTPETSDLLPVKWEPITKESANYYLDINSDLKVDSSRPFHRRMAFWDMFYKFNEESLIGYKEPRDELIVDTHVGQIRGSRATDGDYTKFMGIPYAKVDAANPFGPATPYPIFNDVFDAFDGSAICPQRPPNSATVVGTLDCLHINIYVPTSASSESKVPVLVWIHGGAFTTGSFGPDSFGPKFLVRHDVILVTLNYRLGPYGFMCLDTPEVPGNEGLRDQLKALRWIKTNMEAFGGDINKITLFGESAGGMSADLHLLSSEEKLYNNVIMQSGTSLHPGVLRDSNPAVPLILAEHFDLTTSNISEALTFLSTINSSLLVEAATIFDFRPCVEKDFNGVDNFITDYAINKRTPKVNGMSVLTGYNDDEYLYWYYSRVVNNANEILERINLDFDFKNGDLTELEEIVRWFYIENKTISEETKYDIVDFASDFSFNHPAERSVTKFIEDGAEKVYFYLFSYVGGRNMMRRTVNIPPAVGGATHADELGYLFDMGMMQENPSAEDQTIIDQMTTMWTNFAKYNDPTPEISELLPVKWEPVTNGSAQYYMDIKSNLTLGTSWPFYSRMAFWDLFYHFNEESLIGYREPDVV